jgi:hypothetical protein
MATGATWAAQGNSLLRQIEALRELAQPEIESLDTLEQQRNALIKARAIEDCRFIRLLSS